MRLVEGKYYKRQANLPKIFSYDMMVRKKVDIIVLTKTSITIQFSDSLKF